MVTDAPNRCLVIGVMGRRAEATGMSGMVMVLEFLVLSHGFHIDRVREKTYRNASNGGFTENTVRDTPPVERLSKNK
jgi:hypothetical protein